MLLRPPLNLALDKFLHVRMKMGINPRCLGCLILVGFLITLIETGSSSYEMREFECNATTPCGDMRCPSLEEPVVRCPYNTSDPSNIVPRCDVCNVTCVRECARRTTCTGNCPVCCSGMCSWYAGDAQDICKDVCEATCEGMEEFCNVIRLLQYLSLGIGAILFSINGLKWILSDSEAGREEAKRGLTYVLFGMAVIMTATGLVGYFYVGTISC